MLVVLPNPSFAEEGTGLTDEAVPVRFLQNVETSDLELGDAIPLEITQDVYVNGVKLFAQGSGGIAYIDDFKPARCLGRGGYIRLSHGELQDIHGKKHEIAISSSAKGDFKYKSAAGALIGGSMAFNVSKEVLAAGSASGIIFGLGFILIPIAFLMSKGKEAKLSKGKIMFARILN